MSDDTRNELNTFNKEILWMGVAHDLLSEKKILEGKKKRKRKKKEKNVEKQAFYSGRQTHCRVLKCKWLSFSASIHLNVF